MNLPQYIQATSWLFTEQKYANKIFVYLQVNRKFSIVSVNKHISYSVYRFLICEWPRPKTRVINQNNLAKTSISSNRWLNTIVLVDLNSSYFFNSRWTTNYNREMQYTNV